MAKALSIEHLESASLSREDRDALVALCSEAYDEPFAQYFADIGPGVHLLGRVDGELVSHVMWVSRDLHVEGAGTLQSAYVEAVATLPAVQGRGYASALMRAVPSHLAHFDLAALSPSDHAWYARFGWEAWLGQLACRHNGVTDVTPDEELLVLRLPRTPAALDLRAAIACDWRPGEVW